MNIACAYLQDCLLAVSKQAASGSRDAQTVYRNKETGARMTKEEFEAANKKATEKKKAVYEAPEWGGGMRQVNKLSLQAVWASSAIR